MKLVVINYTDNGVNCNNITALEKLNKFYFLTAVLGKVGVLNGQSKFCSARKIRLLLGMLVKFYWALLCSRLHNFSKCSHTRFLVEVALWKVLVARKANFCQSLCSQRPCDTPKSGQNLHIWFETLSPIGRDYQSKLNNFSKGHDDESMISWKLRTLFYSVIAKAFCSQSFQNKFKCEKKKVV